MELILDTTYLLPALGVGVRLRDFGERFPRLLEEREVLYNPVSLVEAKWIVLGLARREPAEAEALLSAFSRGLGVLLAEERLRPTELTTPEVEEVADELLVRGGLADYFDRMIYATAAVRGSVLLTEDGELAGLAGRGDLPAPAGVLSWEDLLRGRG